MERSRINSHRWLVSWIAVVAWLPSLGCQNVTEERLLGTWELDGADRLAKLMTGGSKSKPAMDGILGSVLETVVDQMEATMEVEFRARRKPDHSDEFRRPAIRKNGYLESHSIDGAGSGDLGPIGSRGS